MQIPKNISDAIDKFEEAKAYRVGVQEARDNLEQIILENLKKNNV